MDEVIKGMIEGYLAAFDAYEHADAKLQDEINKFKLRMFEFGAENSDPMDFYTKFSDSGLQDEYTKLIGKAAMAALGSGSLTEEESGGTAGVAAGEGTCGTAGEAAGEGTCGTAGESTCETAGKTAAGDLDSKGVSGNRTISVKEFVEQYRAPYEEVKKAGYRKRAEAAYERIFAVADLTDDMTEAQIVIEEQRLLWKIVTEDALDIFLPIRDAMDPLQPTVINIEKNIELYKTADSEEKLSYDLEKLELEKIALVRQDQLKITIAAQLANLLIGYTASKLNTQQSGGQGELGKESLLSMITFRSALKKMLQFMRKELDLNLDDLLADEGAKIWLLSPQNVDELGRVKISLNPQNYTIIKDMVKEEILSDLSTLDLLQLEPAKMFWFGFEGAEKDEFYNKALSKANSINSSLMYYQYKNQLENQQKKYDT